MVGDDPANIPTISKRASGPQEVKREPRTKRQEAK
jgi:hypothetical protein